MGSPQSGQASTLDDGCIVLARQLNLVIPRETVSWQSSHAQEETGSKKEREGVLLELTIGVKVALMTSQYSRLILGHRSNP